MILRSGRSFAMALLVGLFVAALAAALGSSASRAGVAPITQPPQPTSGPGGSDYAHADWRVSSGGEGADAWYVFEPAKPRVEKAPLAVIMHGYYEFSGYDSMHELIRHTVRQGSIVIYPRWQTGVAAPCPGPFNIEPCMESAVAGIRGALAYLRRERGHTRPRLERTSYLGFSFGGIITANLANRWKSLGLPKPRAVFLEDPHDGGLDGAGEPALDDSLGGIPASTLVQCHSSADGVTGETGKKGSSCNALYPKLDSVPRANKDLVLTRRDDHGTPALSAGHGVCASFPGSANAYDWNFCWKVWDALRSCAHHGTDCGYALGDARRHRSNGRWSDGVAVAPLKIRERAPIRP